MRRYIPFLALIVVALSSVVVCADTIYLKNGSIIKGKVVNFADDQFVVQLNFGSDRSRAQIFVGDITKIDFDSGGTVADAGPEQPPPTTVVQPNSQTGGSQAGGDNSQRPAATDSGATGQPAGSSNPSSGNPSSGNPAGASSSQPAGTDQGQGAGQSQPASGQAQGQPATDSGQQPASSGQQPATSGQQPATGSSGAAGDQQASGTPATGTSDSGAAAPKSPNAKTASVDVLAKRDWTSTGLIVRRGDHITISASGTVTLDPNTGATSGPEGIDAPDAKKLMTDRPTGGLIAVIGADNDDFIFVGRSADFTAARDGLLFLSVNEGNLSDNVGSYKAEISVEPGNK